MRTKDEINKDLKTSMTALNLLIETSIESEQTFEEKRNDLEKHIKALDDDTLASQVHTLTAVVMEKVDLLFNEFRPAYIIQKELSNLRIDYAVLLAENEKLKEIVKEATDVIKDAFTVLD